IAPLVLRRGSALVPRGPAGRGHRGLRVRAPSPVGPVAGCGHAWARPALALALAGRLAQERVVAAAPDAAGPGPWPGAAAVAAGGTERRGARARGRGAARRPRPRRGHHAGQARPAVVAPAGRGPGAPA